MILLMAGACSDKSAGKQTATTEAADSTEAPHPLPDTLRVGTLYSPTSYFIYRDQPMGYHYDLISRFAADKKIVIDLTVAPSMGELINLIDSAKIDVIACDIPVTADYRAHVNPCGPESVTHQVLVQPATSDSSKHISDVTQLVGREVYVEAGSKYEQRLNNLSSELGGGIKIHTVDRDTLITEQLIAMVSDGEIPLTVVDSDIAAINRTYFSDLDITLPLSYAQRSAWAVGLDHQWLADSINTWLGEATPSQARAQLLKRYFEESKQQPKALMDFSRGRMSAYDHLFRQYASTIHWDWRLLSAMAFTESRYDSTQVSWAGARGIMQLMPSTARSLGLNDSNITNNRENIRAATVLISRLESTFKPLVPDPEERKKFIIAAYNSGPAHILDAIALAKKHGYDPQRWLGQTEQAMMLKSKPQYYNDPVVRYGYFNGRQTFDYVHQVYDTYEVARKKIPLKNEH